MQLALPDRAAMPVVTRKRQWMTALVALRRRIQQLGPYQSLALMLLPLLLVEPLKVVALLVAGHGHWLTGTGMLIVAYGASLVVVERLFKVVKFKLMTMKWFAALWTWFTAMRNRMWGWVRAQTGRPDRPSPEPVSTRTLPAPVLSERVVIKRWR
jgi:hypothetical protein